MKKLYMYKLLKKLSKNYRTDKFLDGLEFNIYGDKLNMKSTEDIYKDLTYLKLNKVRIIPVPDKEDLVDFIIIRYKDD